MAFTQTQLDAIDAAIARGITEYQTEGQSIRYDSLDKMLMARDRMKREIDGTSPTGLQQQNARRTVFRR